MAVICAGQSFSVFREGIFLRRALNVLKIRYGSGFSAATSSRIISSDLTLTSSNHFAKVSGR